MRPPLFEIDRFEDRLAAVHDDLPRQVIRDEPQLLDKRLARWWFQGDQLHTAPATRPPERGTLQKRWAEGRRQQMERRRREAGVALYTGE